MLTRSFSDPEAGSYSVLRPLVAAVFFLAWLVVSGLPAAAQLTQATVEMTQFTVNPSTINSALAVCPGTKRAVGGGVLPVGGTLDNLLVLASGPLDASTTTLATNDGDKATQWYAAVWNQTMDPRNVRVFALCTTTTGVSIESTQFTLSDGAEGAAHAECPAGKRATGGGIVQSGDESGFEVMASGPLDATGTTSGTQNGDIATQWYAAVRNHSGDERTFRVFALCSANSTATIQATALTLPASGAATKAATAVCPGSKRALGGGIVQSGSFARLTLTLSGPRDATKTASGTGDGDKATNWFAAIFRNSGGPATQFKVFAICE